MEIITEMLVKSRIEAQHHPLAGVAELYFQFQPCTMFAPHSHPRGDESVHGLSGAPSRPSCCMFWTTTMFWTSRGP